MSVKSTPFDHFEIANSNAVNVAKANQFYHTAYVQNGSNSWVDKKTVDETSFDPGVEPSMMFDELN